MMKTENISREPVISRILWKEYLHDRNSNDFSINEFLLAVSNSVLHVKEETVETFDQN